MHSKNSGFVLIKLVIAIALLAIVLSVSLQMIGASAKAIRDNRQKTGATFLLQQCLEWTRNIRDSAWRQNLPWDCGFYEGDQTIDLEPSLLGTTGICGKNLGFKMTASPAPEKISLDSIYSRLLSISKDDLSSPPDGIPDKLTATCHIEWPSNGGGTNELEMSEILTNWKKN